MSELSSLEKARIAAEAALSKAGQDLVALDVSEVVSFADVFLIVSGRSDRQVRSIADAIAEAGAGRGEKPLGLEGYDEGRWVLIDWADVIVHVFQEEVREHYDLERLWSDAPRLALGVDDDGERRVV
ncbi:MAG: ribosome silencing factor [Myxococcota bacterium]|nr:ribosome silencing factor [Myxococcota bacterium]